MQVAKDGVRSIVHVGYDGRVHKKFRGTDREKRYANEVAVLKTLENRGCDFVPRLLEQDDETLTIITTNVGHPVESEISEEKSKALFAELEEKFGVIHQDAFQRNITYHPQLGRFCIIDFELADIIPQENVEKDRKLTISWAGESRAGSRKEGNEDALAIFSSDMGWARERTLDGKVNLNGEGVVLALSDGMGGIEGGAIASRLTVSELRRFLPGRIGDFRRAAEPLHTLTLAIQDLHDHIIRAGKKRKLEGMGATLVCGLIVGTEIHFAHVGDSRIYRFREEELTQLTFDHSRIGRMHREGKINERQARSHPHRNVLNQAIGADVQKVVPQVGTVQLADGDWLLFCSDGVIDGLWDKNIAGFLSKADDEGWSAKETATAILDEAVEVAGQDDTTLFVVKVSAQAGELND